MVYRYLMLTKRLGVHRAPSRSTSLICYPPRFGDILSDAASVLPGSLGLMASASLGNKVHM